MAKQKGGAADFILPYLDDPAVREALQKKIDQSPIIERILTAVNNQAERLEHLTVAVGTIQEQSARGNGPAGEAVPTDAVLERMDVTERKVAAISDTIEKFQTEVVPAINEGFKKLTEMVTAKGGQTPEAQYNMLGQFLPAIAQGIGQKIASASSAGGDPLQAVTQAVELVARLDEALTKMRKGRLDTEEKKWKVEERAQRVRRHLLSE